MSRLEQSLGCAIYVSMLPPPLAADEGAQLHRLRYDPYAGSRDVRDGAARPFRIVQVSQLGMHRARQHRCKVEEYCCWGRHMILGGGQDVRRQ